MKVLMVSHYFDSHRGGIELVAGHLFRGLARPDCEIVWAAAGVGAAPEPAPYSSALSLPTWNTVEDLTGLPMPIPSIAALRKLYCAVKAADVVLLQDCLYLTNIAAFLFARMLRIPTVVVQHIGMVPHRNRFVRSLMSIGNAIVTRFMLASAQQVVFISETIRNYFGAVCFRSQPKLIFNGADCDTFHPLADENERTAIRARLDLPQNKPVALFVGRFVEKKGLGILREMVARESGLCWAFAGTGPIDPARWGQNNVRVYSTLQGHSLAELYRASDIFVLPSTGEGFPLVLQEALASGLPVVCSAEIMAADQALSSWIRGVNRELDQDRRSAANFLQAIHELLKCERNTEAAHKRYEFVRSRYSWSLAVNAYFEILSSLADKPAAKLPASLNSESLAAKGAAQGRL
jgi:glycosyltransferase involved in cell wall biosynthesis